MKTKNILAFMIIITSMLFVSCKKEAINPTQPTSSGASSLRVKMTDSPGEYASLDVSIVSVQAYLENAGWVTLNNNVHHVSVLKLSNGITTDLSYNTNVAAGLYTKLKLIFGNENTITVNAAAGGGNASGTFQLTWLGPKEVEIPIYAEVKSTGNTEVVLDFDAVSSIREQLGEYIITPVIKEIKDMKTGVRGAITAGAHAAVVLNDIRVQSTTYADAKGDFILYSLKPGTYTMKIFPTAEAIINGAPSEFVIENVVVTDGKITQMGTIGWR
ncbi:MAG: DUF4382 domain-containing protein [Bacteroidota bacterium]|nr:DUF4382 domain-containing protein [Bacteroidota bacterium]